MPHQQAPNGSHEYGPMLHQVDRADDTRHHLQDSQDSASNTPYFATNLPSLSSFTAPPPPPSAISAASTLSTGHLLQGPQQHPAYIQSHANLPPLPQTVPRREIESMNPRRDPGQVGSPFPPHHHRQDQQSAQEASQQDQMAKSEVVQAAQRAAEAGYRPLNVKDALSYLDQVKVQFYDQPDVYNKFLDIMKDFKSQRYISFKEITDRKLISRSIDTPGVIERVSTLFRGHPALVQGFNTFLPPGYRIECSKDPSDPNPIRVTTPQGTMSQVNGRSSGSTQFSAPVPLSSNQQAWRMDDHYATTNAAYGMTMVSQAASAQQENGGANGGDKKPVEFNHAINYVNKIKNRFSNEPDTYKHFLEILQTYQKDAKPIQEVYSQVTDLFKGNQDLLQDFKQFLPENNASTSAAARLPAVGTFAPPATVAPATNGRDRKRRPEAAPRATVNKKPRSSHRSVDLGPVSPNLIPGAPEPLTPGAARPSAHPEDLAFFDKAKKHMNSKSAATEFMKVVNLYARDIINKNTLVEKVDAFLGGSKDLMDQFKKMVHYTGTDEIFENSPAITRPKIDLSSYPAVGPSYRQLPKSETLLPCSGRDDMCWEVLNDIYVSHPTWASEDAGFVTHKKNQYEEALHKIEEERYEYDLNIEANLRTISLLEPIAQRISTMSDEDRRHFRLPPGLGGQSIAIYQKVIKKIYDKSRGQEVIEQLHDNPVVAVPIVLKRLKQKDEEWKRAQREWNKVWRETEGKNYYKSLDHQGTFFKAADKKVMTVRNMVSEIETLAKTQDEARINPHTPKPRFQYEFSFERHDICLDIQRLLDSQISRLNVSTTEKDKMTQFNHNFIPIFFGITRESLVSSAGGDAEDLAALKAFSSGMSTRRKKAGEEIDLLKSIMKKTRESAHSRKKAKIDPDTEDTDSAAPSRGSTPALDDKPGEVDPTPADDMQVEEEAEDEEEILPTADHETELWTEVNQDPNARVMGDIAQPTSPTPQDQRQVFNLFSNATFYTFLRWFQMIYDRLYNLKILENEVTAELKLRKPNQLAVKLGLVASRLSSLSIETSDDSDHYEQLLILCDNLIQQTLDSSAFEDMLRHIYGVKAFKMYTIDKITFLMVKQMHSIVMEEKNIIQTQTFYKDRSKATTTPREQIIYRIQTEATIGAGEQIYRSEWNNHTRRLRIQLMGKDEVAHAETASKEEAWRYYLDSWIIAKPTLGVSQERCQPLLARNLPADGEDDIEERQSQLCIQSKLELKICMNTYKIFYIKGTEDILVRISPVDIAPSSGKRDKFLAWLDENVTDRNHDVLSGSPDDDVEMTEG